MEIWPNGILFEFGVLKTHPKFTFQNLRRIINYSVEKGSNGGGYPLLSWTMWRHMACNKLEIEEQLAWAYFEFFDAIQETNVTERVTKEKANFIVRFHFFMSFSRHNNVKQSFV